MPKCCVATCGNYSVKTKGTDVKYYCFPSDPIFKGKWIEATQCENVDPAKTRICSVHFDKDSIKQSYYLQQQFGLPQSRGRMLKDTALPTLHLPSSSESDICIRLDNSLLVDRGVQTVKDKNDCHCPSDAKCKVELEKRLFTLIKEKEELQKKHHTVVVERDDLKELVEKMNNQQKHLSDILEKVFTPGQLKLLLNRTSRVKWSTEDIIPALALRRLSKKSYEFLKNVRGFPLPGLSTLRKWVLDQKKKSLSDEHDYTKIKLEESQILCQQTANKKQILNRNQNFDEKQKVAKNGKIIKKGPQKKAETSNRSILNQNNNSKILKTNVIKKKQSETNKQLNKYEPETDLTFVEVEVHSEQKQNNPEVEERKFDMWENKPLVIQVNNNKFNNALNLKKRIFEEDTPENLTKRLKINNLQPFNMELIQTKPVFLLKPQFVIGDTKSIPNIHIVKKEQYD